VCQSLSQTLGIPWLLTSKTLAVHSDMCPESQLLGRSKVKDYLNLGIRDQPGQCSKTLSL
jgi:hypothetical protein